MRIETRLFALLTVFFFVVVAIYALWSGVEPVGTGALTLTALLSGMIAVYLGIVGRRIDARPEDDPHAEIAEGAGDQGVFSPWSWWPLLLGIAAAVAFLGLAIGWWLVGIGAAIGVIGLVGWVLEFSSGQHAH